MPDGHDPAMRLRVAYLSLHRRTNAELAPLGLTADQFVLLTSLVSAGGVTQKELVRPTGSDPKTMGTGNRGAGPETGTGTGNRGAASRTGRSRGWPR
jgi:hypothetical protein